jgi:hypothetical protein
VSFFYRPSILIVSSPSYANGADLILSDHGRDALQVDIERIEMRERMASGRMRSKHIADKHSFSTSWNNLPSRRTVAGLPVVADGYASANDMYEFYKVTSGQFTLKVYADRGTGAALTPGAAYDTFSVFFADFSMEVTRRGKDFDFFNVSINLEEA